MSNIKDLARPVVTCRIVVLDALIREVDDSTGPVTPLLVDRDQDKILLENVDLSGDQSRDRIATASILTFLVQFFRSPPT